MKFLNLLLVLALSSLVFAVPIAVKSGKSSVLSASAGKSYAVQDFYFPLFNASSEKLFLDITGQAVIVEFKSAIFSFEKGSVDVSQLLRLAVNSKSAVNISILGTTGNLVVRRVSSTCVSGEKRYCYETSKGSRFTGAPRLVKDATYRCTIGIQTCTNGVWGSCLSALGPVKEICNVVDDNCNSQINEGGVCVNRVNVSVFHRITDSYPGSSSGCYDFDLLGNAVAQAKILAKNKTKISVFACHLVNVSSSDFVPKVSGVSKPASVTCGYDVVCDLASGYVPVGGAGYAIDSFEPRVQGLFWPIGILMATIGLVWFAWRRK